MCQCFLRAFLYTIPLTPPFSQNLSACIQGFILKASIHSSPGPRTPFKNYVIYTWLNSIPACTERGCPSQDMGQAQGSGLREGLNCRPRARSPATSSTTLKEAGAYAPWHLGVLPAQPARRDHGWRLGGDLQNEVRRNSSQLKLLIPNTALHNLLDWADHHLPPSLYATASSSAQISYPPSIRDNGLPNAVIIMC